MYKGKKKDGVTSVQATEGYKTVKMLFRSFLTTALNGGEWLNSRPGCFTSVGKEPQYPLNMRLGLDVLEKRKLSCLYRNLKSVLFSP